MTVFDDQLYWADTHLKAIIGAHKYTAGNETTLLTFVQPPNDMEVELWPF
jgi:hypothetical protein